MISLSFRAATIKLRAGLIIILLFILFFGCSEDNKKIPVIGILNLTSALDQVVIGFKKGMADMGYQEGDNIKYVYHGPAGSITSLEPAAQKLLNENVDLIFSLSTPATKTAKKVTKGTNVPIVFGPVTDPVGSGLVNSMTDPGGNLTGVASGVATSKSLEWFKRVFPDLKKILAFHNPKDSSSVQSLKSLKKTAQSLGLSIVVSEIHDRQSLEEALTAIPDNIDGLYVLPSAVISVHTDLIAKKAVQRQLLTASTAQIAQQGIAVTYGIQYAALGEQASRIANQILKGSKPSELPVQLAEFFLEINLNVTRAVGSDISDDYLAQADKVIN